MYKQVLILYFFCFTSIIAYAQIPNNSFEQWTTVNGYQNPTDWDNLNEITKSYSVFTCVKLSPGNPGNNYLSLKTVSITGKGLIPGKVVSGKIDTLTYNAISGFPFTQRPSNLIYNMQYMVAMPTDTAFVSVLLTKWNSFSLKRDTVAYGISKFNAMAHQWFSNSTVLNYKSGENPDSSCIVISSSGKSPIKDSYIYIDNLNFNGNVIGINENISQNINIQVFPNPANEILNIHFKEINFKKNFELLLFNQMAELVYSSKDITGDFIKINIAHLTSGVYLLKIKSDKEVANLKIIIE